MIDAQDIMAWVTQGADRRPHEGEPRRTDNGIAIYRRMVHREIGKVEGGEDPMVTIRDAAQTSASICRRSATSTTTVTASELDPCARTRPIRRSPTT